MSLIFLGTKRKGWHVPWEKMDLANLRKPRLRCKVNELEMM